MHFKNTRESAAAIRGLSLVKAKAYLEAVIDHKRCIPFLRYNGARRARGGGRQAAGEGAVGALCLKGRFGAGACERFVPIWGSTAGGRQLLKALAGSGAASCRTLAATAAWASACRAMLAGRASLITAGRGQRSAAWLRAGAWC